MSGLSILKDLRFVLLIVVVFASIAMLGAPRFVQPGPLTIDSVDSASKCSVKVGDSLSEIYSTVIRDSDSFVKAMQKIKSGDRVTMVINGGPLNCEAIADASLGFTVRENRLQTLKFGIDIEGGTRVLLNPTEEITEGKLEETIKTLENRINFYGLKEVKVNTLGNNLVQIETSGTNADDVRDFLSKQGKFEGKLEEKINLEEGNGTLILGNKTYDVLLEVSRISVDGGLYSANETISLDEQIFDLISVDNSSALLHGRLFTGEDIVNVLTDTQNSYVRPVSGGFYEFSFGIQITRNASERFAKLTQNQPVTRSIGTSSYIEPKLLLFLDGKLITDLNIASSIAGQSVTTAVITGSENSLDGAAQEKLRLESTLRSGSLPVRLDIARVDTITQTEGRSLINSTIFVAIAGIIAVGAIVSYRYRDFRIVVPMIVISLSEIVIVVGMATSQILAGVVIAVAVLIGILKREVIGLIGWITLFVMIVVASTIVIAQWTIDIPVIAGLIAILGTGVNQMIIMTDQLFKERGRSLPDRHKSAMHIIWSSAAIVVFAMIPLILGGIGSLKGFAIATIVGVLVGILVTRPAYVALIERMKRVQLETV